MCIFSKRQLVVSNRTSMVGNTSSPADTLYNNDKKLYKICDLISENYAFFFACKSFRNTDLNNSSLFAH